MAVLKPVVQGVRYREVMLWRSMLTMHVLSGSYVAICQDAT